MKSWYLPYLKKKTNKQRFKTHNKRPKTKQSFVHNFIKKLKPKDNREGVDLSLRILTNTLKEKLQTPEKDKINFTKSMLRDKRRNVRKRGKFYPSRKKTHVSASSKPPPPHPPSISSFFSPSSPFPPPRHSRAGISSRVWRASLGEGKRERAEGERERVPRRGGCQQCNEWRSILSLGQARAFTPRCSPGDTEPRVVARGITGGVLTLGRGGGRGWVAHGTLPSADRGATYASHPFVRNDDGVHPSWASSFSDGLDPIPLAN